MRDAITTFQQTDVNNRASATFPLHSDNTPMRIIVLPLLLLPNLLCAQADAEREVLAVIDRFFEAMTARDTATMAQTVLREGALFATDVQRAKPAKALSFDAYMLRLAQGKERYVERYWNEKVSVHGTVASVEMRYDFHIDGSFSHCGTDLFTLVQGPDGWRIASVAYDRQKDACPPSPLGPVK